MEKDKEGCVSAILDDNFPSPQGEIQLHMACMFVLQNDVCKKKKIFCTVSSLRILQKKIFSVL